MLRVTRTGSAHLGVTVASSGVDEVRDADLSGLDDDDLLALMRDFKTLRNRVESADHSLLAELDRRGVAVSMGARSTAGLLRDACRVHPVEARARVRAALAAGPRRTLTGCPVEPQFPLVAAAQSRGSITARHAQVIVKTIDTLPDVVRDEHGGAAEATLVENAELFDPHTLSVIAEHLLAHLDPDGRYRDIDYRDKHRDLLIRQRADGSGVDQR